jgi:hypothetical protein
MALKKLCCLMFLGFLAFSTQVQSAGMQQTVQINTHFRSVLEKPTWLLILRDVESGQVLPYIYDVRGNDNFWIAFSTERTYRVTVSNLTFGKYAVIHNFCDLQNGIIEGKSIFVSITGELTPDPKSFRCHVLKYQSTPFTVSQ